MGYLGAKILMAAIGCKQYTDYWRTGKDPTEPYGEPAIFDHITQHRFEQIHRYLYIYEYPIGATEVKVAAYEKVDDINDRIRKACQQYWSLGRWLSIDERMQPFKGRSKELVTILSKVKTPTGWKVWGLADAGYMYDWLWHVRGDGPVKPDTWPIKLGYSKTACVVFTLMKRLPDAGRGYGVFMDNLFTTTGMLHELRKDGIGAAGTIRLHHTRTELLESGYPEAIAQAMFEAGTPIIVAELDDDVDQISGTPSQVSHFHTHLYSILAK
jgi:hypothetical protein